MVKGSYTIEIGYASIIASSCKGFYTMKMMNRAAPRLVIVIPCYNEAEVFSECLRQLEALLQETQNAGVIRSDSSLLFVDDGSIDTTWEKIEAAAMHYSFVQGVKLSRNVGHQAALLTGLSYAQKSGADAIVSIDADLQDDITAIPKMVAAYQEGYDVIYGVRSSRERDTWFKRISAEGFYKLMALMGVEQVFNHADFRLMSQRALQNLLEYKESNAYLRGLVPLVGFPSTKIYYSRGSRFAGDSKYPLKKMISLAIEGITSMTISPLRIISGGGILISLISVLLIFYIFFLKMMGHTVEGWSSVMLAIFFMGGIQMLSLGVLGEYIGKIYLEVKNRPISHVEKIVK
ncbi:glycosyltransferase family 2 protein [Bombella saccharophila]|uniref:Glycosyltransferase family 2 protein n=1 Tax=Bombella saccharophila TaxID=2967338 RepID=A0ABT3W673_9PROT|nr:glycosyltransferase family 2 protein [Bombella saccharophila]MCX5614572.1 glycosyltransferase family 2 protein [Bombella saccharophila]